jgi:hypothetical protein
VSTVSNRSRTRPIERGTAESSALDGTALDGTALDGTALDGTALDVMGLLDAVSGSWRAQSSMVDTDRCHQLTCIVVS